MQNPWKVIAAFIGVFIAGAVFGGFFAAGVSARWSQPPAPQPPAAASPAPTAPSVVTAPAATSTSIPAARVPNGPANQPRAALVQPPQGWQAPQLMRRYAERLQLTSEQKEHVIPLIQRAADDYRRLQQNTFRETAIILQRLQQDIAKELNPEQRDKLEKMQEAQFEKVQKMDQRQREQKKLPPALRPGGGNRLMPKATESKPAPANSAETTTQTGAATEAGAAEKKE